MKLLATFMLLLVVGCASIEYVKTIEHPDGTLETHRSTLRAPKHPLGESYIISDTNGLRLAVSGAQGEAGIQQVKGASRNRGLMYGACALIMVLGAVAFGLPNYLVSNKDGLIICGIGLAGFAALRWVEASAPVMMWVLPMVAVGGAGYLLLKWRS